MLHRGAAPKLHKYLAPFASGLPVVTVSVRQIRYNSRQTGKCTVQYLVRLPQSKAEADEVAIVRCQVVEDVASLGRGIIKYQPIDRHVVQASTAVAPAVIGTSRE